MRPWMKILPLRWRHTMLCKWKQGYQSYCMGHGKSRVKFGGAGARIW